jgi:hypothetical protein
MKGILVMALLRGTRYPASKRLSRDIFSFTNARSLFGLVILNRDQFARFDCTKSRSSTYATRDLHNSN